MKRSIGKSPLNAKIRNVVHVQYTMSNIMYKTSSIYKCTVIINHTLTVIIVIHTCMQKNYLSASKHGVVYIEAVTKDL